MIRFHGAMRPDAMDRYEDRRTLEARRVYDACMADCRQGRETCKQPERCKTAGTWWQRLLGRLL